LMHSRVHWSIRIARFQDRKILLDMRGRGPRIAEGCSG
jgi:hypothetical protein